MELTWPARGATPQDNLELSDDSDIEVHPNVDKRSFIRAKQNKIHMERQQRRHQIETLKYERVVNEGLMARISGLLDALRAHADEARSGAKNPAELAFRAVMESAAALKPEDDVPPPPPEGVHANVEQPPSYTKMMAALLDQVNKALDEKGLTAGEGGGRYDGMLDEVAGHLSKVKDLQGDLTEKLAELEKEEGRKITSESIHTGFDSSFVAKSSPEDRKERAKGTTASGVELLNPGHADATSLPSPSAAGDDDAEDEDEMTASADGKKFGTIASDNYAQSLSFLSAHPHILAEKEQDGLLVLAFDAALRGGPGDDEAARRLVHQALLLQYCRALGRDGVALFFKRVTTPGHQARDVFATDVRDTYARIRTRAREITAQRARDAAAGVPADGVEQIQLHAVEPGTVINIHVPPATGGTPEEVAARAIFDAFAPDFRAALESGSLDKVNQALGRMTVPEAEDVVGKLGEVSRCLVPEATGCEHVC